MSQKAFLNAQQYLYSSENKIEDVDSDNCVGIGVSGALRSNYEKKGPHNAYVTIFRKNKIRTFFYSLHKNARTREEEDHFLSENILKEILESDSKEPSLVGKTFEEDSVKEVESIDTYPYLFD